MEYSKALNAKSELSELEAVTPPLWNGPARIESPEPRPLDDGDHPLLDEVSTAYSASVIQRAFITWVHLGKKNSFRHVCDYYHRLEDLEMTFTLDQRVKSRRREYSIISRSPPLSSEFVRHYGHIYGYQQEQSTSSSASASPEQKLAGIWGTNGAIANQLLSISNGAVDAESLQCWARIYNAKTM
ncbi:hypothetical protein JYU34_019633 [Plutella xylostella]|uniref:Uncharacterized protein n=2 Tax=Plutella xylostella TaxID=51655 RepID=A0ABQ7PX75_PLUXY|nr:hypothetical protein JYU34_019633 [Plutella xylostella]CAG9134822.1 unnamed protein product [Plutella xylostella]